jgi:hypothetical protein
MNDWGTIPTNLRYVCEGKQYVEISGKLWVLDTPQGLAFRDSFPKVEVCAKSLQPENQALEEN